MQQEISADADDDTDEDDDESIVSQLRAGDTIIVKFYNIHIESMIKLLQIFSVKWTGGL